MQDNEEQLHTMQDNIIQCKTMQWQYNAIIQCWIVQYTIIQYNTMQCNMEDNAMQYKTMQHNVTQRNAI